MTASTPQVPSARPVPVAPGEGAVLAALSAAAPPLALVDASGHITWCSQAFAQAVAGLGAAALQGTAAQTWLGAAQDQLHGLWNLSTEDAGSGQRLLQLHRRAEVPVQGEVELQRTVAELRERVALMQEFCHAGVFERDPVTMAGRWDEQMYRIFGLPVPPPGTPAPAYQDASQHFFAEDRTPGSFVPSLGKAGNYSSRMRLQRADGQQRHIHSQWKVIHDAQGRAVRVLGVNIDDTETYELARQTQKLREELELALQFSDIGLWRHALAEHRVHLDERAARHVGLPFRPEGYPAGQVRAQIHPDDLAAVDAWVERTRSGSEAPSDLSLRYRRPDGGWRHVLARGTLQRSDDGRSLAFVGVMLDESERVQQAQRAQQLSHRLESAAEAARLGLWSSPTDDDAVPDWNRRNYELFGLDPAQGPLRLGDWLRRCAHPEDRARVAELGTRWAKAGAGPFEIEFRALHPDGRVRWLITRGKVTQAGAGTPRRIEGVTIDVTEQHETLQRLRESSQRMELIASSVGLGSWEYVSATGHAQWDAAMFRLRGVESATRRIEPAEVWSYVHPDDRVTIEASQAQAFEAGRAWSGSFRVVWPDGTVRWLASRSLVLFDEHGQHVRRIGLNRDITDLMQAEQAMRERERAVAESRAKSRFLSRISHELRTPLNAVLGFAQLLRSEDPAGDAAQRQRWLGHIEDAGRLLLALIDDVLDLSRAESGDLRLDLQAVPLAELITAAVSLVEHQARASGLTLEVAALPAGRVQADPLRARQVLLNLLSNAIKYNRPGGHVWVSVHDEGSQFRLAVRDSGRGLEPERLQQAFEPFNRLGAERLGIEGTGIGLPIAKALVEQMGGAIHASSRPGTGSTFAFTLPAATAPSAPAPALDAAPATGGPSVPAVPSAAVAPPAAASASSAAVLPARAPQGPGSAPKRVLYIEDNEVNALLVREVLAKYDWVQLETAADGHSGLLRARENPPDLLLLDMHLPDMSGLIVLHALRSDPATAGLRCVALSASAMPDDIRAAREAGVVDYWTKPISFPDFVDKLAALLGRGAATP